MAYLAYRFRLYPTPAQKQSLLSQVETLRRVYNAALGYWKDLYERERRRPNLSELYKLFSGLRNLQVADLEAGGEGPHWLAGVSAMAMRDTLKRVVEAYRRFFLRVKTGAKKAGFPRFKSAGRFRSIPFDNYGNGGCVLHDPEGRSLRNKPPQKRKNGYRLSMLGVGKVRVVVHRNVVGRIKTAAVFREPNDEWYVVLFAQQPDQSVEPKDGPAVGIDLGLQHFLTTSDGEHVENPRFFRKELPRLRRLQRAVQRKRRAAIKAGRKHAECRNLAKANTTVARLHVRVRYQRREFHHRVAGQLVERFATVCAESLNVPSMYAGGPYSLSVQDAGWAGFLRILKRKAERAGARVVEVDPRGTSQTCPRCQGAVKKTIRDRVHSCPNCGLKCQRDHASAMVILSRGVGGDGSSPAGANVAGSGERCPRSPLGQATRRIGRAFATQE